MEEKDISYIAMFLAQNMIVLLLFLMYFSKIILAVNDSLEEDRRSSRLPFYLTIFYFLIFICILQFLSYVSIITGLSFEFLIGLLFMIWCFIIMLIYWFACLNILISARLELNKLNNDKEKWYQNRSAILMFVFFTFITFLIAFLPSNITFLFYLFSLFFLVYSIKKVRSNILIKKLYIV